jgi:hypothetical protein
MPGTEATFSERAALTQLRCLQWLHIAKQFYRGPISAPEPSRGPPPISFLNLLIDWIDGYAVAENRKQKPQDWRWDVLRGFVHDHRRVQSAKLLNNISRLAKSIASYFTKPPFDNRLLVLWESWNRIHSPDEGSGSSQNAIECENKAVRVFDVLKRIANGGKVVPDDYSTLEPYVSEQFHETLHEDWKRKSRDGFIARAAAMDVYVQYRRLMDKIASDQDYISDVTTWHLKLGEPEARPQFEAIHWRFCGHALVNFERRPKKVVRRSGPRKLR